MGSRDAKVQAFEHVSREGSGVPRTLSSPHFIHINYCLKRSQIPAEDFIRAFDMNDEI